MNVIFKDAATDLNYMLYVSNGDLQMKETQDVYTHTSLTLQDRDQDKSFVLFVSESALKMDETSDNSNDNINTESSYKIITEEEVIAGINTRAYLSIDVSKGGYNSAYMVVEEQDPDTGEWSQSYYHELYDNYNSPDLDLSNATGLSDEEKQRILTNIGAASYQEFMIFVNKYDDIDRDVSGLRESLGDIDAALDVILDSLNTSIGGDV